jgi:hypothetical protein
MARTILPAACAGTGAGPGASPAPLVRATLAPEAAAGAAGETRFAVTATRDGVATPADCAVEGRGFRAEFRAPAEVAVPSFGAASAPVRVACAAGGRAGAVLAQPATRRIGGGGVFPAVGVGVSSGGDFGVSLGGFVGGWGPPGPGAVAARYPDVAVALRAP